MLRRLALLSALAVLAALVAPAPASAAPPAPFGHACNPQNGVLFCPTANDSQRVSTFDGVPLDVDVTLPPSGDGPFPTIVMLHGFSLDKANFETTTPEPSNQLFRLNNTWYAQRGYAVVNYTARGHGRSCGKPDSRTAGCERGWFHYADQRFEVRDTQHLLGLLVDQGIARPDVLGVTGISWGGGQTMQLAFLKDRVRRPDGSLAPWTSPNGTPLSIAAAYPTWGWSDFALALAPNGRFLDSRTAPPNESTRPIGVDGQSFTDGLYILAGAVTYLAPKGADPTVDPTRLRELGRAGDTGPDTVARIGQIARFSGIGGIDRASPAPLLILNGWTDELFAPSQALRAYNRIRAAAGPSAQVSLQFGDIGHGRGSNKLTAYRGFNQQASDFFDAFLRGGGSKPAPGSVLAYAQTCPKSAPDGGPYTAPDWRRLHRGGIRFGSDAAQRISSKGGSDLVAKALDPNFGPSDKPCTRVKSEPSRGTAVYERRVDSAFTLLGLPTIRAKIRARGKTGELVGRLWDVKGGTQVLVSRAVYRLTRNQRGRLVFQLNGNGWRFRKGHRAKLELLGRDAPTYRAVRSRFSATVSDLTVALPVRERPSRRRGIGSPR